MGWRHGQQRVGQQRAAASTPLLLGTSPRLRRAPRFSIAWPRILLDGGRKSAINPGGVAFYNALLNEMEANGIEPAATMFHCGCPFERSLHARRPCMPEQAPQPYAAGAGLQRLPQAVGRPAGPHTTPLPAAPWPPQPRARAGAQGTCPSRCTTSTRAPSAPSLWTTLRPTRTRCSGPSPASKTGWCAAATWGGGGERGAHDSRRPPT